MIHFRQIWQTFIETFLRLHVHENETEGLATSATGTGVKQFGHIPH